MTTPLHVTVDFAGERQVSRMLLAPVAGADNLERSWNLILDKFDDWIADQFDTRGDTFGTPWDPLADSTIEAKTQAGYSDPEQPLVATGALFLSLQGGPGGIRRVDGDSAELGTHNPDLGWHHGRARSGSNPVPRRPVFELDEARRRWVVEILRAGVFRDTHGLVRDRRGRFAGIGL